MELVLVDKRHEAPDAMSFILHPIKPLRWQAGQFLHYTLPHANPDERGVRRYFSIASAPHDEDVMITTRLAEKGSSFKKMLATLPMESKLTADAPEGDFVVTDPTEEIIFIALGVGVTPYRSILRDLDHRKLPINITLLYANQDENFIYKDELEALTRKHEGFKIRYFISPNRINEETLRSTTPDVEKPLVYVSGSEMGVEAFDKMLRGMGVPPHHVKSDYFLNYDWN